MTVEKGMVFTSRYGKRYAVAEFYKGSATEARGWSFWSIANEQEMDGRYSEARIAEYVEAGSLVPTEERFDVEAAQRAVNERTITRKFREAAAAKANAEAAAAEMEKRK